VINSDHFEGFDEKIIFDDFRAKRTGGGYVRRTLKSHF